MTLSIIQRSMVPMQCSFHKIIKVWTYKVYVVLFTLSFLPSFLPCYYSHLSSPPTQPSPGGVKPSRPVPSSVTVTPGEEGGSSSHQSVVSTSDLVLACPGQHQQHQLPDVSVFSQQSQQPAVQLLQLTRTVEAQPASCDSSVLLWSEASERVWRYWLWAVEIRDLVLNNNRMQQLKSRV